MKIKRDFDLKPYNTFGISISARTLFEVKSAAELTDLLKDSLGNENRVLILGEGSNILFTKDIDGIVLLNQIEGKEVIQEDDREVYLKVFSGESWSDLVDFTVKNNWGGLENLSLIPGTVGAAPVQNIGAYDVELKDILDEVEAFSISTGDFRVFKNIDCRFAYRDSIFKSTFKGQYFITAVVLRLSKKPILNLTYAPLKKKFEGRKKDDISISEISNAVKVIRRSKLPDPRQLGNAGSFFKNPVVPFSKVEELVKVYPEIPFYKMDEENFKIAAGWLIEKAGWKGKRIGDAGVHEKQALVLVNYGKATGREIYDLSEQIKVLVNSKFGVELEKEVTVI